LSETWQVLLKEGGAIAALVVVFFILKLLVPLFSKRERSDGNGKNGHSGQQPISFWRTEIRDAVRQTLIDNAPQRHADMEKLMERVIEREFIGRNEKLREMMKEVIGDWLDKRLEK
jgi:hypothetical protein